MLSQGHSAQKIATLFFFFGSGQLFLYRNVFMAGDNDETRFTRNRKVVLIAVNLYWEAAADDFGLWENTPNSCFLLQIEETPAKRKECLLLFLSLCNEFTLLGCQVLLCTFTLGFLSCTGGVGSRGRGGTCQHGEPLHYYTTFIVVSSVVYSRCCSHFNILQLILTGWGGIKLMKSHAHAEKDDLIWSCSFQIISAVAHLRVDADIMLLCHISAGTHQGF